MTVFHLIDSGGLYGAEQVVLALLRAQRRRSVDAVLCSIGAPGESEKAIEQTARAQRIPVYPVRRRALDVTGLRRQILELAARLDADVIHNHGYKGSVVLGLLTNRASRPPLVTTMHGWTDVTRLSRLWLYSLLELVSLRFQDAVVVVDETMIDARRLRARADHLFTIPNGIDFDVRTASDQIETRRHHQQIREFARGRFTVGAVGRLSPEKAFVDLLEAFAAANARNPGPKEYRLVILGEGLERVRLERRASELGIADRVLLPGFVPNARASLSAFDLFVLSSHQEGMPVVVLEAMVERVPIIATRVGAIPRMLEHGECGVLVEPGRIDALAEQIRLVAADPEAAAARAGRAHDRVATCHSTEAMAAAYDEVYARVTGALMSADGRDKQPGSCKDSSADMRGSVR